MFRTTTTAFKISKCLVSNNFRRPFQSIGNVKLFTSLGPENVISGQQFKSSNSFNHLRTFSTTNSNEPIDLDFQNAQSNLAKVTIDVSNEDKLSMYALFKQAHNGPCNIPKPSMLNIVEKAKWQAWKELGDISPNEAKNRYIAVVGKLLKASGKSAKDGATAAVEPVVLIDKRDRVCWITLNRPKQMNAVSTELLVKWTEAMQVAAQDPDIKITVVTGNGKYFSSGNDLKNFEKSLAEHEGDMEKASKAGAKILEQFVNSVIDFPKPLIGAVNGPALGISFTILALFDTVICSDTARFQTPFSALGLSPEGCSTRTFPKTFGTSLASELLYYNYHLKAEEAYRLGFVSRIVPADQFESHIEHWLYDKEKGLVNTCYPKSMINAKALVRNETERRLLREANQRECDVLVQSFQSEECIEAIQKFFMQKSKQ